MNNWYIAAQVLGFITICFEFASYQIKDKTRYFLITGIGSFFWMTMFIAMGMATGMSTQLSLVVAATYSTIRNLVFYRIFLKDTPESKEAGLIFLLVMIGVAFIAGTLAIVNSPAEVRWLHTLGMMAAISFVVGQYLPGVHYVRVTVVIYAIVVVLTQTPLNILYGDFRWNIMGILIESAKIISVVVFYVRFAREPKKPQLQFAKA
ncbi:MAG: YgjV family protein [Defluviitaleaceae bacterium]|nr:YgjV family protein [Defluviitaleaceae bacterium]